MAKAKQDKYIDLDQFPHDNNGKISWKDSVGIVVEFFYNGERHELEVLTIPNKPCGTYPTTIEIPSEYDIYNKYDEWVRKGKIKPVEETIYKDCPYIEHK